MMRVSRRNWFVRFAYLIGGVPWRSSLCALFWRGVVLMPAILVGLGMLTAMFVVQFYMYPLGTLRAILICAAVVAGWIGALTSIFWIVDVAKGTSRLPAPIRDSLPVKAIVAAKSKFCPIVDLSDDAMESL